ncbi:DNA translocase FtsK [Staphylococcus sp. IVB6227]|uniref:DNA translocase FtsK n=1 Tax=Staphylococcus sp. IVB6227 TaxID=2989768 RepID=UPI0021D2DBAC|nr:DNA translocase FtsK [Staphylococcus sp. IVB6227]UXR79121.1 DNA translocase FtsK [Staphylococcus sp. IVB6227]
MSWFDKLFGEEDKSTTGRSRQNRSQHPTKKEESDGLIRQTNDIYQRPKGKFRFPIDMHDEAVRNDEANWEQTSAEKDDSNVTAQRPSYSLDRTQRRHRSNVRINHETVSTPKQQQSSYTPSSSGYQRRQNTTYRATGERDSVRNQEIRPSYHRPEFRASEVPSAIFGTKQPREIKNSGLKQPLQTQGDKREDRLGVDRRKASTHHTSYQKERVKKETPNYSKRDNTINIENIYASQIVEEIRREREKKALQKKRFKASLEQKRAAQQKEEGFDIQRAIDEMHAQQAKQLLGADYDANDVDELELEETSDVTEIKDSSLETQHSDEATEQYHYEEVDLSKYTSDDNKEVQQENQLDDVLESDGESHDELEESAPVNTHFEEVDESEDAADAHDTYESTPETDELDKGADQSLDEADDLSEKTSVEKETPTKPIRRHAKPFNVLMTPSDKKRHMERQKEAVNTVNRNQVAQTHTHDTTQQSSERVSSPEIVDTTSVQTKTEQDTAQGEKKIRRGPMIHLPSLDLLDAPEVHERDETWIAEKKQELNDAFYYFNVPAEVVNVIEGPSVTRFELSVEKGVKVSRITALQDDIKMALAAKDIRIEAPIPGTSLVGIEVPNQNPMKVNLRAIIESESFKNASSKLTVAMGNRINNEPLLMDIAKTPHALIAGATGSGKSVSINSILISLLYRNHPEELKLLLIDPKMVELAPYNDLPHLVAPVITDVKVATQSLKWAVDEMERRYKLFAQTHVRNITAFNKKVSYDQRIPKIVIVIDELADLMMMAPQEVEQSIARLAQKARACGIHMLVATQRPSVNVITGLIKANIPTRIAFMVSSSVDSRTILDSGGAERLLGYGDMLYLGGGMNKPIRVQGTFVSDEEIDRVVDAIKAQRGPEYLFQEQELLKKTEAPAKDELFYEVCEFMVREQNISTSLIQRHFQIGYNRAARIIDQLEQLGYISGANGSKPRDVYLTETELNEL